MEKRRELNKLLRKCDTQRSNKLLIFAKTKRGCDQLATSLGRDNYNALAIHGDKQQFARDSIIQKFKRGYCNILVATDVASRGLDIKDIKYVINYDFPMGIEDYIHRIGRTGRAGSKGTSYTFFTYEDGSFANELIDLLRKSKQQIDPQLFEIARTSKFKRKRSRYGGYGGYRGGRPGGFGGGPRGDFFGNRSGGGMGMYRGGRDAPMGGRGGYDSRNGRSGGYGSSRPYGGGSSRYGRDRSPSSSSGSDSRNSSPDSRDRRKHKKKYRKRRSYSSSSASRSRTRSRSKDRGRKRH